VRSAEIRHHVGSLQPFHRPPNARIEIGLQGDHDPYARGDSSFSFWTRKGQLKRGYITLYCAAGRICGEVGKMRSVFGKVNLDAQHVLPCLTGL